MAFTRKFYSKYGVHCFQLKKQDLKFKITDLKPTQSLPKNKPKADPTRAATGEFGLTPFLKKNVQITSNFAKKTDLYKNNL